MSSICTIPQQPDITRMKITLLIHVHYLVMQFEASRLAPIYFNRSPYLLLMCRGIMETYVPGARKLLIEYNEL